MLFLGEVGVRGIKYKECLGLGLALVRFMQEAVSGSLWRVGFLLGRINEVFLRDFMPPFYLAWPLFCGASDFSNFLFMLLKLSGVGFISIFKWFEEGKFGLSLICHCGPLS